jgi:hypothetical protein
MSSAHGAVERAPPPVEARCSFRHALALRDGERERRVMFVHESAEDRL